MRKRISSTIFWLTVLSVASSHNILVGLLLYPIAATAVLFVFLSPFALAFGAWLLWYWLRHHRLPGWLTPERLPAWLVGVTPRRLRRRLRRRRPRPPRPHEAPTAEMPAAASEAADASPAGQLAGQAAGSHVA
jgi:hypothetical protein